MLAIQKVILIKNQQNLRKLLKQTKVVVKRVLLEILKKIRINNVNRVLIEHININSVSTKFDILPSMVKDNIQILTVLETKIDSFFHKRSSELNNMLLHLDMIGIPMAVVISFL